MIDKEPVLVDNVLRMSIMSAIAEERTRQDSKWGAQNHLDPVWLTIMAEEFGETAKAMLDKDETEVAKELIQTIAVGVSWLEAMARRPKPVTRRTA